MRRLLHRASAGFCPDYASLWKRISILILALVPLSTYAADSGPNAKAEFEKRYRKSKMSNWSPQQLKEIHTVVVLKKDKVPVKGSGVAFPRNLDIVDGQLKTVMPDYENHIGRGQLMAIVEEGWHADRVDLSLRTLNPEQIEQGADRVKATGTVKVPGGPIWRPLGKFDFYTIRLRFFFPPDVLAKGDLQTIYKAIDEWLEPFQDVNLAIAFSQKLQRRIDEIKEGMAIADVEKILGPPELKFTREEKTIYKYKDVVVEFKNEKVEKVGSDDHRSQ